MSLWFVSSKGCSLWLLEGWLLAQHNENAFKIISLGLIRGLVVHCFTSIAHQVRAKIADSVLIRKVTGKTWQ
jgi:hypothetical protein